MASVLVQVPQNLRLTDDQFLKLVEANPDLRMERTANGELIIMPPTGSEGGSYNAELTTDLAIWNRQTKLGVVFDSSTGFKLPNGATRSPDSSWVRQERWDTLSKDQKKGFAPLCPDFVLELVSETDDFETLQNKMCEYIDNGCCLGWLIDPKQQRVEIYEPDQEVVVLESPTKLSGEDVLPGFTLNLEGIWESS